MSPRFSQPPRRPEEGAAAVEFALVFPVFAALVMGSMDLGYYFFAKQIVTNAAREGARAGTTTDPASGSALAIDNARNATLDYMAKNGLGCPGGGSTCVQVATTTIAEDGGPSMSAVDVVIQYPFVGLTGFTANVLPRTVSAHAIQRWR
jgi:Flp pilus assembly protein TadG